MKKKLTIGNAQGFWGDQQEAPARLVQQYPTLDYLTLDYLSEVSLSILAIQKEKDITKGYAQDFLTVIRSLAVHWKQGSKVKLISNAGGLNPKKCAEACAEILNKNGCGHLTIGIVSGDDVLSIIKSHSDRVQFSHLDSKESISDVINDLVTANAYFGAKPIAEALIAGADIVITGRIADPSLTVGPCAAHFGWSWSDYDRLAGATIAGHLIECGTQVTGGISTQWLTIENPANIGFPIVEMEDSGTFVITKPEGTSGVVNEQTVKEQLLYEIGDPDHYLSPDVSVSFLSLQLTNEGTNRIRLTGAKGKAPPSTFKVSATYRDGFKCEATLAIFGRDSYQKGKICGNIILERLQKAGYEFKRSLIECLGAGDMVPGIIKQANSSTATECVLRIAVADPRPEALERFSKEIAPLVTSGPQGTSGYISGRPRVRPIFGYWPCLIDVKQVLPIVELIKADSL